MILTLEPDIALLECTIFEDALDLASEHQDLDLAILSLRISGMDGVDGIRKFRTQFPEVPVIASCCHCEPEEMVRALRCGAAGFLPERLNGRAVKAVIELVWAGQVYVPADVLSLLDRMPTAPGQPASDRPPDGKLSALTRRESETLELLVEGLSNKGIARALAIQEVTVKLHLRSIFRKLGAANRAQAVRIAVQSGWFGSLLGHE